MRWTEKDLENYQRKTLDDIGKGHGLPIPTEEIEQNAVARYLDLLGLHWFHVPNGGHRGNKVAAAKLKVAGVKRGVPDIMIIDSPPLYPCCPGVIIEMKRKKGGTVSEEQRAWLNHFEARGWQVKVCKGANEALAFLKSMGW